MHSQNTAWAWRRAVVPPELKSLPRNLIHMLSFPYTNLVKGKGYIFRFKKAGKLVRLMTATQESVPSVRDDILHWEKVKDTINRISSGENTHQGRFDKWHSYQQKKKIEGLPAGSVQNFRKVMKFLKIRDRWHSPLLLRLWYIPTSLGHWK